MLKVLKSPAGMTTVPPPAAAAALIAALIAVWFATAGPPDTAPKVVMSKNGPCGSGRTTTPLPVAMGIAAMTPGVQGKPAATSDTANSTA